MYPRWRTKRFFDAVAEMASNYEIEAQPNLLIEASSGARPGEPADDR